MLGQGSAAAGVPAGGAAGAASADTERPGAAPEAKPGDKMSSQSQKSAVSKVSLSHFSLDFNIRHLSDVSLHTIKEIKNLTLRNKLHWIIPTYYKMSISPVNSLFSKQGRQTNIEDLHSN